MARHIWWGMDYFSSPFFLRVLACGNGVDLSLNSHLQQPKFSVCLRPLKPKSLDFGVLLFPLTPLPSNSSCSRVSGFSSCFASGTKDWTFLSHGFNDTFKTVFQFCLSHLTCQGGRQLGHWHSSYLGLGVTEKHKAKKKEVERSDQSVDQMDASMGDWFPARPELGITFLEQCFLGVTETCSYMQLPRILPWQS